MGFSVSGAFAVLLVGAIIVLTSFFGSVLPQIENVITEYTLGTDRDIEQVQSGINITDVVNLSWWDDEWSYRKMIILNHDYIDVDLQNFPVLIDITDTDLKNHAQSNAYDIIFINSDQTTILPYERETYVSGEGRLVGWVNIPQLYAKNDTYFFMYYGGPQTPDRQQPHLTWNSDFVMVQHLSDNRTSTTDDSTRYENHGTKKGANEPTVTQGKVWMGQSFDGENDYIRCGTDNSLVFGDGLSDEPYTLEAWFYTGEVTSSTFISKYDSTAGSQAREMLFSTTIQGNLRIENYDESIDKNIYSTTIGSIGALPEVFHYLCVTYEESGLDFGTSPFSFYIDGNVMDQTFVDDPNYVAMEDTNVELYLGAYKLKGSLSDFLYGLLDEVRISNVNRSSDWIQTTYNTIMYPSLFLDTEPQQNQNFTYLKITAENSGSETRIIENYNVLVNGTNSSFVSLQPYHYPDTDITLLVNVSVGGTKDNKIITDNGRSDYFPFTFP